MQEQNSSRLRLFQLLSLLLISIAFWALRAECLQAENVGGVCLDSLTLLVKRIATFGTFIRNHYPDYALYEMEAAGGGVVIILLTLAVRRQLSWWAFLYLLALVLTGWGELWALRRNKSLVLFCDLGAFAAALLGFTVMLKRVPDLLSRGWVDTDRKTAKVTWLEVLTVLAILSVTCATRFYQLNRHPAAYDGEECPHRLIADSWSEILEQEVGAHVQQSSGMSWVALRNLFTRVDHSSLFYLDERLLSTAVSLLACLVMFFFVRSLRGPFAGVMALLLYSLGPLDIEWARLTVMHSFPVILGILLAWATLSALNTRSWWSFLAIALLIPFTKFVYPSAKMAAAGPLAAMVGVVLFTRKEWRGHIRKFGLVLVGLGVFICIRSVIFYVVRDQLKFIPPFDNPYPASASISQFQRIQQMLTEGLYFFYEIFFAPANPTHWTIHATFEPVRSLSSISVVFLVVAFTRLLFLIRKPEALVFLTMISSGLLPAMATQMADRRVAVSVTLCLVLGVLEIAWLLDTLVARSSQALTRCFKAILPICVFITLGIIQTTSFFTRPLGRPMQMQAGDAVLKVLKNDTLVVYLADESRCEMFYTLYTRMIEAGGSIAFATAYDTPRGPRDQILHPQPVLTTGYYTLSQLQSQIATLKEKSAWAHYVFIFQPTESRKEWIELLHKTYPTGKESTIDLNTPHNQRLFIYEVDNSQAVSQTPISSPSSSPPPVF